MTIPSAVTLDHAASLLEAHPDFRILRRLQNTGSFYQGAPLAPLRVGVSIDVETTGLDQESDCIIELAIQRFRFDSLGRIIQIGQPRVWREDPARALDPRITMLTGLTDADLAGQALDESAAIDLLASADVIIAHNAAFDRPFVDRRLPAIAGKPWACSMAEIDWLALGFEGRGLSQLVSQCGWFYEGHRAENDILALIHLLGHVAQDGETILAKLMAASDRPNYRIHAVDAPFEAKDVLKARAYRWDAALRFWWRSVAEDDLASEQEWLEQEVYLGRGSPAIFPQTASQRYRRS